MAKQEPHVKVRSSIKRNRTLLTKHGTRKFDTVDDLVNGINDYFATMDEQKRHYTVSGLCLHLGISGECLRQQEARGVEWAEVCEMARLAIENYAEEALFEKDSFNGAKFALINRRPKDWKDKVQADLANADGEPFTVVIRKFANKDSEE